MAELAVQRWFEAQLSEALDEAVCEYAASVLQPEGGEAPDLEEARELMAGFSGRLTELPEEQQTALVLDLIAQVQATAGAQQQADQQQVETGTKPVASGGTPECLRKLREVCLADTAAGQAGQQAGTAAAGPDTAAAAVSAEHVETLAGLCGGGASPGFLAHLLARHSGDVEAAAAYLLDAEDLGAEQRAWERAEEEAAAERRAAEEERLANRKKIVEKFQLQVVSDPVPARKPEQLKAWQPKEDGGKGKVRYRDGMLVATKGEKYIVEKIGEDWDGGSRGKVMSKGKRGKGFY